jgi:hypothetical protein
MNIGTQVTFNLGWETKTGNIIWLSYEFAWVKDQTDTIHQILISELSTV